MQEEARAAAAEAQAKRQQEAERARAQAAEVQRRKQVGASGSAHLGADQQRVLRLVTWALGGDRRGKTHALSGKVETPGTGAGCAAAGVCNAQGNRASPYTVWFRTLSLLCCGTETENHCWRCPFNAVCCLHCRRRLSVHVRRLRRPRGASRRRLHAHRQQRQRAGSSRCGFRSTSGFWVEVGGRGSDCSWLSAPGMH